VHLVQILLPLYDNDGGAFAKPLFARVRNELVERFGGLTAYTRAPASGVWQETSGEAVHDDVVIYEVMVESFDEAWWRQYRVDVQARFGQDDLVVRALAMVRI
jgi:hypothetical protein